jgi:carbon-monoxide dehydrogenase small subunit
VQQAFQDNHGMQCGFCTPGFVVSLTALLTADPHPTEDELVDTLDGHLCRCTGYQNILRAGRQAAGLAEGGSR